MFPLITLILSWLATHAATRGGLRLVQVGCLPCQIAEAVEELKTNTKLLPIAAVH